jgi:hypothetical protein
LLQWACPVRNVNVRRDGDGDLPDEAGEIELRCDYCDRISIQPR